MRNVTLEALLEQVSTRFPLDEIVPPVDRALQALSDDPDQELGDLLIRLLQQGDAPVAHALLEAAAALHPTDPVGIRRLAADHWERNGRQPFAPGYGAARAEAIQRGIHREDDAPGAGVIGLDERAVEYPWLFRRMTAVHPHGRRVLDAGSVLNHHDILAEWRARSYGPLSIVTLQAEPESFPSADVRYEYADLRELPYRDELFATVLCLSTLEHVGMDNRLYGDDGAPAVRPRDEVLRALEELRRVLVPGGRLLASVPCGGVSDRGWFRLLPADEVEAWASLPGWHDGRIRYFRAALDGWREVDRDGVTGAGYNEPGGLRTAPAHVAAAEAVALVELTRG